MQPKNSSSALLPLVVFLVLFIGTGSYLTMQGVNMAFYQLSAAVAIIPAIVLAVLQGRGKLEHKISSFIKGVGEINIITMALIYILAGAFATVASSVGGVSSTVNFGLSLIPANFILPGLFIISAFIATAMGTSMGTVAAMAPIALGVGNQTDISLSILMASVVGGAMFGDNLSMISDTTIAATRTQGCEMKDKFILNFRVALPVAIITIIILFFLGSSGEVIKSEDYEIIKVLPYIAILVMAVAGINVFLVLLCGILFSGLVGMIFNEGYTLLVFSGDIYKGFASMNEIMILSMMLGGLGELIKQNGGINWLLNAVDSFAKSRTSGLDGDEASIKDKKRKTGEGSIAFLSGFADICLANNTVAIIITGGVSKEIATKNDVDPKRAASIMDMVSCALQGLLPYGAQLLLAGSIAKISPLGIAVSNWYCVILFVAVIVAIKFSLPRNKKS